MSKEDILLGIIPGPVYPERCGHGGYIATFECYPHGIFDLYVFNNPSLGQELCLRFGEEDSQYCSPGNITSVIHASTHMEEYKRAIDILKSKGKIIWVPNE